MDTHPFFALLLMYLKYVAVPGMKKISTNGRCIYFAPDFLDKLYDGEIDYILCHQVMHIIYGHIWRPFDLAGDNYHFACDIAINNKLAKSGLLKDSFSHLGYMYRSIPSVNKDVADMTPQAIYEMLPYSLYLFDERTRSRYLSDSEIWWDEKDDIGVSCELILDLPDAEGILRDETESESGYGLSSDGEELKQEWQAKAASAANTLGDSNAKAQGADDVPDFVKRMISKMKEATIDWKKILNNFVQERICDYSFSPPDRRYADTGFFLPDFNESDFVSKEILFMVDTSGSITDDELSIVYSEIRGATEQFNGKLCGKLGFFDAKVTQPLPFESISDILHIIPYGGGGTDFRVIFDYIRNNCLNELPACLVVFTDGYGPYPSEAATMRIPVLWMINNLDVTPPWGKVTRVLSAIQEK